MSDFIRGEPIEIEVPGLTIRGKEWGRRNNPSYLGVHGWLDNAGTFDLIGPHLESIHLIGVDFPGHGLSDHLGGGAPYHFFDLVTFIADLADALDWDKFNVLGHSMGAAATFVAAGVFPERIGKMFMIDSLGPWTTTPDDAPEQMAKGLEERRVLMEKTNRVFDDFDEALQTIADIYDLSPSEAEPIVKRGTTDVDGGISFTYDLMLRGTSLLRLTEPQLRAFMERISSPVRVIRPTDGWPVDEQLIKLRLSYLDEVEIETLEGGHHIHLENPKQVADFVGQH